MGSYAADAVAAEKQYGPGVTDTEIKIGQTVPYSGPASAFSSYGRVMTGYFQMLNEKGGINGRKVNLISRDNAFSPPKAIEQATSFNKERVGMLLPGIELTNSRENYAPYRSLRMAIFEKTSWKLLEE